MLRPGHQGGATNLESAATKNACIYLGRRGSGGRRHDGAAPPRPVRGPARRGGGRPAGRGGGAAGVGGGGARVRGGRHPRHAGAAARAARHRGPARRHGHGRLRQRDGLQLQPAAQGLGDPRERRHGHGHCDQRVARHNAAQI